MTDLAEPPVIHPSAFVAEGAVISGDVTLERDVSIWHNAVLRADCDRIVVGAGSNIQDGCVVHEDRGKPVVIGRDVTVGHGAIIHGCTIGDGTLVGMGAIVLNGAVIGENSIVGAGALVTKNTVVPPGSLILGSPAKIKRALTEEEIEHNRASAAEYCRAAKEQLPAVCR